MKMQRDETTWFSMFRGNVSDVCHVKFDETDPELSRRSSLTESTVASTAKDELNDKNELEQSELQHRFPPSLLTTKLTDLWETLDPLRAICSCSSISTNGDCSRFSCAPATISDIRLTSSESIDSLLTTKNFTDTLGDTLENTHVAFELLISRMTRLMNILEKRAPWSLTKSNLPAICCPNSKFRVDLTGIGSRETSSATSLPSTDRCYEKNWSTIKIDEVVDNFSREKNFSTSGFTLPRTSRVAKTVLNKDELNFLLEHKESLMSGYFRCSIDLKNLLKNPNFSSRQTLLCATQSDSRLQEINLLRFIQFVRSERDKYLKRVERNCFAVSKRRVTFSDALPKRMVTRGCSTVDEKRIPSVEIFTTTFTSLGDEGEATIVDASSCHSRKDANASTNNNCCGEPSPNSTGARSKESVEKMMATTMEAEQNVATNRAENWQALLESSANSSDVEINSRNKSMTSLAVEILDPGTTHVPLFAPTDSRHSVPEEPSKIAKIDEEETRAKRGERCLKRRRNAQGTKIVNRSQIASKNGPTFDTKFKIRESNGVQEMKIVGRQDQQKLDESSSRTESSTLQCGDTQLSLSNTMRCDLCCNGSWKQQLEERLVREPISFPVKIVKDEIPSRDEGDSTNREKVADDIEERQSFIGNNCQSCPKPRSLGGSDSSRSDVSNDKKVSKLAKRTWKRGSSSKVSDTFDNRTNREVNEDKNCPQYRTSEIGEGSKTGCDFGDDGDRSRQESISNVDERGKNDTTKKFGARSNGIVRDVTRDADQTVNQDLFSHFRAPVILDSETDDSDISASIQRDFAHLYDRRDKHVDKIKCRRYVRSLKNIGVGLDVPTKMTDRQSSAIGILRYRSHSTRAFGVNVKNVLSTRTIGTSIEKPRESSETTDVCTDTRDLCSQALIDTTCQTVDAVFASEKISTPKTESLVEVGSSGAKIIQAYSMPTKIPNLAAKSESKSRPNSPAHTKRPKSYRDHVKTPPDSSGVQKKNETEKPVHAKTELRSSANLESNVGALVDESASFVSSEPAVSSRKSPSTQTFTIIHNPRKETNGVAKNRVEKSGCPICSARKKTTGRHVVPVCVVRGADLTANRNENDPWNMVMERGKIQCGLRQNCVSMDSRSDLSSPPASATPSTSQRGLSAPLEGPADVNAELVRVTRDSAQFTTGPANPCVETRRGPGESQVHQTRRETVANKALRSSFQSLVCPSASFDIPPLCLSRNRSPRRSHKTRGIATASNRLLYIISEKAELTHYGALEGSAPSFFA